MPAPARKNQATQAPPKSPVPDALGERHRAQILAEQLLDLQGSRFRLDLQQEANGREDADPIDGAGPNAEGEVLTYGGRRQMLKDAERRLADAHPQLMPAVRATIHAQEE